MNDDTPTPAAHLPAPQARPVARRTGDGTARLLAVVALVATGVALWLAIDTRTSLQGIESTAGGKLAELGAQSQGARNMLTQVQSQLRDAQARVAEVEARLADSQEQRVTLEEMYRELSRSADDRVLADVEQTLLAASQQLQLAGNVRGALAALQAADARLARAEKLASTPLRRAITADMDRLKAVPQSDTVGLAVKLDGLMQQVDALPLLIAESPPAPRARMARADEETAVGRAMRTVWEDMKGLVRIRELDTPEPHLLAPAQAYFLRENLKLRQQRDARRGRVPRRREGGARLDRQVLRRQVAARDGRARDAEAGGRDAGGDRHARHQREPGGRAHRAGGARESAVAPCASPSGPSS